VRGTAARGETDNDRRSWEEGSPTGQPKDLTSPRHRRPVTGGEVVHPHESARVGHVDHDVVADVDPDVVVVARAVQGEGDHAPGCNKPPARTWAPVPAVTAWPMVAWSSEE
jgi:hypothetical protein